MAVALKGDFQISEWTVQPQVNALKKGEEVFHLEPKVMQVLVELASAPNETLTREHLLRTVWPGTYVSDHVLTRCVSELRRILDDDPRSPRFIQNVPKMGYRLIAQIATVAAGSETVGSGASSTWSGAAETTAPATPLFGTEHSVSSSAPQGRHAYFLTVLVALALIATAALVFVWKERTTRRPAERTYRIIPFTSFPGSETQPAFSPDGNEVAFVWNDEGAALHIFVKQIGNETPLQISKAPNVRDLSPAWSPDQKSVAFIRQAEDGNAIYLVPAIGGSERRVHRMHGAIDWDNPGLSWSPDGKQLIFPDGKSEQAPSAIYSLSLDTLEARPLTNPPNAWDGDYSPAFSPDGTKIAFVRGSDAAVRNIYMMDAQGREPRQLTFDGRLALGLAWAADGESIIFSSDRGSETSLWQVSIQGGAPRRLPMVGIAINPAVSPKGDRLAYSEGSANWSTVRLVLKSPSDAELGGSLLSSTEQESAPAFSPDDHHVAFQSWRSGSQEIWECSSDGSGPVKLTSFDGALTGSPNWSPDGSSIAFDSRVTGWSHIFIVNPQGGVPHAVTSGDYNDIIPSWSRDGRWIYFASKRSGIWQIWKVNVELGSLTQVTTHGGFVAAESPDGNWLYYTRYNIAGLWRMSLSGQKHDEVQVLPGPPENSWGYWSFGNGGIYFLDVQHDKPVLAFAKLNSSLIMPVYNLPRTPTPFSGITVSHDGRWLLYTEEADRGYNIKLVENFH